MRKVTNLAYRKSRGTEKPFTSSDEQVKAIWNESVRQSKWRSAKATPASEDTPSA